MPTYITLYRYTDQGSGNIKESPNRMRAYRQALQDMGGELKAIYLTIGQYDNVAILEFPDDATVAQANLALVSLGNVRTETLRAFTEDEFRQITDTLP